jgi:hypothetical protein
MRNRSLTSWPRGHSVLPGGALAGLSLPVSGRTARSAFSSNPDIRADKRITGNE